MEDLLKFLFIASIIAIGIYKEASKAKAKKPSQNRPAPSATPTTPNPSPLPAGWDESKKSDDFFQTIPRESVASRKERLSAPSNQYTQKRTEPVSDTLSQSIPEEEDFTIHSAEEARRAIIWGEILQRKY